MTFTPHSPAELIAHLDAVPIFPLPGVVFLPASLLPLHVFEPRYRDLVHDAVAGAGLVAVPQLAPGWQSDYDGAPEVHRVAGLGQVVRHQALPDGRHNIILVGLARVHLVQELPVDTRYRQFRCQLCEQVRPAEAALARMVDEIRAMSGSIMAVNPELAGALARVAEGAREPIRYVDTVAHLVLTDAASRQDYIEQDDVAERVGLVQAALATALAGAAEVEA